MNSFLDSLGYNNWVLPALLIIPVLGAVLLIVMCRSESGDTSLFSPVSFF